MKTAAVLLLSLALIAGQARADHVLIYSGSVNEINQGYKTGPSHQYLLFDLDSLTFDVISYYRTKGQGHYNPPYGPIAFVSSPITLPTKKTQTNYTFGNATMTSPFFLQMTVFSGTNTPLDLGGGFAADCAKTLSYISHYLKGNGTTDHDTALIDSGVFHLVIPLTQESNAANDDLNGAIGIVNAYLIGKGYTNP